MEQLDQSEAFVTQLTENQNRLYGYVYSLLGDHSRAADVVQETNLVLWRKLADFNPEKPFLPWAFSIARFQVLAHLRDKKRDRLLLDAELAEAICVQVEQQARHVEDIQLALRPCLTNLTTRNHALVEGFYFREKSINELAEEFQKSSGAIKVALLRIRKQLAECVRQRLASE